ncbi:hypothetical protein [Streptomyces sp. Ac-502]|uniref:hypothetical protein n=1 Tax=Streptomyces sp. Ac-502 TaxID=3342801 RepID=UPI003862CFCF
MTTTFAPPRPHTDRRIPLSAALSSWAAPVTVVGQFALLSGIPVMIALVGALRQVRDRAARLAAQ